MDQGQLDALLSTAPYARLPQGAAAEFRVWAEIIDQSAGLLHVFLPLLDRGIDAVVHNRHSGAYTLVQVKSRSVVTRRSVLTVVVPENRLIDDEALVIAVLHQDHGLGPLVLVVRAGRFRELATHFAFRGRPMLSARFSMHPRPDSRWAPYLVPLEDLGVHLLGTVPTRPDRIEHASMVWPANRDLGGSSWLGFAAETEVIRRLALSPDLELYRPFPDVESAELVVRSSSTRGLVAFQVKAASYHPGRAATAALGKDPFPAASNLWVVVLACMESPAYRFHDECLVIPSEGLADLVYASGRRLTVSWTPGGRRLSRVQPFRHPLAELASLVADICSRAAPTLT